MNQEPRNPLYFLLLAAGLVFTGTALAVAIVPVLEDKARDAGQPPAHSEFRAALGRQGWQWLLWEAAAVIVLGLASMAVDRCRRLQKERAEETMRPVANDNGPHQSAP